MKNKIKIILILFFACHNNMGKNSEQPIVWIPEYMSLFGNQIYQFCAAKILSEELQIPLVCPPIFGFPETYSYQNSAVNNSLPNKLVNKGIFLQTIQEHLDSSKNNLAANFIIRDHTFPYRNLVKYKNMIKKWLEFDKPLDYQKNPNDIVLHVRIYTITYGVPDFELLPISYYENVLSSTNYDQVYICTNEPSHPYLENFKKYNPIIVSSKSLHEILYEKNTPYEDIIKANFEEFRFMASFNKIATALSTFSWWAAYLSNAHEIFVPVPSYKLMYPQDYPEEQRYKFIQC